MKLTFKKIRYKNFLSFGNTLTELDLLDCNKTLLIGKNGNGKSCSILDPLTFALFGKPYRKINKANVVNSINKKDCLVEVEFNAAGKDYKVVRGIKPNIFEVYENEILLNQDASTKDYQEILEKNILKTNFKSFTQIVILGSARYTPFMLLSSSDRRLVIEDLLDLQVFSAMNIIAKDKLNKTKSEITDLSYQEELLKEKITTHQYIIKHNKKKKTDEVQQKKEVIQSYKDEIKKLNETIVEYNNDISSLTEKLIEVNSVKQKKEKYLEVKSKATTNKSKYDKIIKFYTENDNCPTCKQHINTEFKDGKIQEYNVKIGELEKGLKKLEKQLEDVNLKLTQNQSISVNIQDLQTKVNNNITSISNYNNFIETLDNEIQELLNFKDTEVQNIINGYKTEYKTLHHKLNEVKNQKKYLEYAVNLLKDGGIKTKIIKKYLPILNKLINNYLSKLDFFVNFTINESFEEEIKSRHRDSYQYTNFSEGEKTKIDLALMLAFRELAKLKNGVFCNLLLMDEILDSSLDENSIGLFLDLLDDLDESTNIFIISHRTDEIKERFDRIIKFEKVKNFSKASVIYD